MLMPQRKVLLIFVLLLMVGVILGGCADQGGVVVVTATPLPDDIGGGGPSPTATPGGVVYDQSCAGLPGDGFVIQNSNPCLVGQVRVSADDGTAQCRPEQFDVYSVSQNIEGYPDEYSAHAPIECNGGGFTFPVTHINGEWGFTTKPTTLDAGCYIAKLTGTTVIDDPDHPNNYMAGGYLQIAGARGQVELKRQPLALNANFELIWPFTVNTPASILSTMTIIVGWGTALPGSEIVVHTVSISSAPVGYCAGEVPEL